MTSQQKDKFICQRVGIRWYEINGIDTDLNPDFESEAGRVQLLGLVQRHGWIKFIQYYESPLNILLDLTDDTGKFRDEVFRWMGGEGWVNIASGIW